VVSVAFFPPPGRVMLGRVPVENVEVDLFPIFFIFDSDPGMVFDAPVFIECLFS